jgi:hypothetical protein
MVGHLEAMLCADVMEPFLEVAVGQLDDTMAARADEVVVMSLAAEPVVSLGAAVG